MFFLGQNRRADKIQWSLPHFSSLFPHWPRTEWTDQVHSQTLKPNPSVEPNREIQWLSRVRHTWEFLGSGHWTGGLGNIETRHFSDGKHLLHRTWLRQLVHLGRCQECACGLSASEWVLCRGSLYRQSAFIEKEEQFGQGVPEEGNHSGGRWDANQAGLVIRGPSVDSPPLLYHHQGIWGSNALRGCEADGEDSGNEQGVLEDWG